MLNGFRRGRFRNARGAAVFNSSCEHRRVAGFYVGVHLPVALFLRDGTARGRGDTGQVITDNDSRLCGCAK